jgi:hypothetical protein
MSNDYGRSGTLSTSAGTAYEQHDVVYRISSAEPCPVLLAVGCMARKRPTEAAAPVTPLLGWRGRHGGLVYSVYFWNNLGTS